MKIKNKIYIHSKTFLKRALLFTVNFKKNWQNGGITKVTITKLGYNNSFEGTKALITGGSSGIGYAIAAKLIECGAEVVITGRNSEKLKLAKNKILNNKLHTYVWDISDVKNIGIHMEEIQNLLEDDIDILVNNAGVLLPNQGFLTVSEEIWDQTYATNLKGAYFLSQYISNKWIKTKRSGKILNISSQGGFCTASYPYRMTKWDMVGMTKGLGKLLAPHNIIVNGIAPGMIATDMISRNTENVYSDLQANNRLGLPEEIAELACFLLSPACLNIIGQTIICDGGYTLNS